MQKIFAGGIESSLSIDDLVGPDGFLRVPAGLKVESLVYPRDGFEGKFCLVLSIPGWPFVIKIPRNLRLNSMDVIDPGQSILPGYRLAIQEAGRLGERLLPTRIVEMVKIRKADLAAGLPRTLIRKSSRFVLDHGDHLTITLSILQVKGTPIFSAMRMLQEELASGAIELDGFDRRGKELVDGVMDATLALWKAGLHMQDFLINNVIAIGEPKPPYLMGYYDLDSFVELKTLQVCALPPEMLAADVPLDSVIRLGKPTDFYPQVIALLMREHFHQLSEAVGTHFDERAKGVFSAETMRAFHGGQA